VRTFTPGMSITRGLFSVDLYTYKAFNPQTAVSFTRDFFRTKELAYKECSPLVDIPTISIIIKLRNRQKQTL
jgi:hypothetical protein